MKRLLTLLLILNIFASLKAQPGTLDKSFGEGGKVEPLSQINDLALQADGKIVTVNDPYSGWQFRLNRYNTDGQLDTSFGDKGIVATIIRSGETKCLGVTLQNDGKIIAAGYTIGDPYWSGADFVLVRYLNNGAIDSSFGENGKVIFGSGISSVEEFYRVIVQPDGKIVACGYQEVNGMNDNFALMRFDANGSIDSSFGINGLVVLNYAGWDYGRSVALQDDGKILIAGRNEEYNGPVNMMIARFNNNGIIDKAFGLNGISILHFRMYDNSFKSMVLQKNGDIVVGGGVDPLETVIVKLKSDGDFDSSFANNGVLMSTPADSLNDFEALVVQADNKIVLDGVYAYQNTYVQKVKRYNSDGSIDSSFGENGTTTTRFGDALYYKYFANTAAIQKNGDILFGASLLTRYNGYDPGKQPLTVRIKRWLLHHGISWQMQPNKEVRYYAIQRSADGIVYKEIAKLSNKTQVSNYEDAAIINGSSYYRLAAIGWDGARTYSNTILIDESAQVKLFPNPVRDNLQLQGLQSGKTSVSIVDLQGNVRSSSVAGGANYSINTSQLTPGNYLLKLQHNNVTTTLPFVKE